MPDGCGGAGVVHIDSHSAGGGERVILERKSHPDIVAQFLRLVRIIQLRFNRPDDAVVTVTYAAACQRVGIRSAKQVLCFTGGPPVTAADYDVLILISSCPDSQRACQQSVRTHFYVVDADKGNLLLHVPSRHVSTYKV